MKRLGTVALALALGFALSSSCAAKREVTIDLNDICANSGKSLRDKAAYQEFLVFPGKCPDDALLAKGDTRGAKLSKVAPADGSLPEIGDLPKGPFGLAVLLRDEQCTVMAFGCTNADLESVGKVKIVPCGGWDENGACICDPIKGGGCFPPATCQSGKCVSTPNPDAGPCSLQVERAGTLAEPAAPTASVTGPGITATDDGFVIAFRDQNADSLRAIIAFLPDDQDLGGPAIFDLGGCSNKVVTDGVGVAYEQGLGLVATSLPDCGKGAGAVFVPFDSKGTVEQASGPRNPAFLDLTVAPNNVMAPAAIKGEYELVYRVNGGGSPVIERVVLQGPGFKSGLPIVHPFGEDDIPFAMVATSPQIRAFLAPVAGEGGQTTQVRIGNRATDTIDDKGTLDLDYSNKAASITAWDNKIAAAVPASAGWKLTVASFVNNSVQTDATGVVGTGTVYSMSMARLRSHLFVAQGHTGGITVHRLEGADGKINLKPADTVELPASLGAINLSTFDGTHMAIAAARDHVAVAWLSKPKLAAGDPSGGWALLKCAEE